MTITGSVAVSGSARSWRQISIAVHARQVEIEQHQLRRVLDDGAHAGFAVGQPDHAVALALEHACQQRPLGGLILDDQHQRSCCVATLRVRHHKHAHHPPAAQASTTAGVESASPRKARAGTDANEYGMRAPTCCGHVGGCVACSRRIGTYPDSA